MADIPFGGDTAPLVRDLEPVGEVHLFRGAPPVRGWSKYQTTVKEWALCGRQGRHEHREIPNASESIQAVTCVFCLQLAGRDRASLQSTPEVGRDTPAYSEAA